MVGINLKVQIEMNGQFVQAGHITGSSFRDAVFSYDESYITSPFAHAISLSLPLSKKAFDTDATKSFFDGLLPEGFTRQCVADSIHASSDDYIPILRQLGNECLGAIQIIDEENPSEKASYIPLTIEEIKEWGQRDLAYEINDFKKGYYVKFVVNANNEAVAEYDRICNIKEDIIRHILVKE